MNTLKRPVHLDPIGMKFTPMAVVSILHRLSGIFIFLILPYALYLLHGSLQSPAGFQCVVDHLSAGFGSFVLWAMVCAVFYHLLAGVRHLFMDVGVGEQLCAAHFSAYLVMALEVIVMIVVGVWIWG